MGNYHFIVNNLPTIKREFYLFSTTSNETILCTSPRYLYTL